MSSRYAILSSITTTSDLIQSERDPIQRAANILEAIQESSDALEALLAEAIYEARMSHDPHDIIDGTGLPDWKVRHYVASHMKANPGLKRPKGRSDHAPIPDAIDMSRGATQSMSTDE